MNTPSTIESFFAIAERVPDRPALKVREQTGWKDITWSQYADRARRTARALMALGVETHGTVAILSPNRPEWLYAAVGAMLVRAAPAGVYPTSTAEQAAQVVRHSKARVAFVADDEQLTKLLTFRDKGELPDLTWIVRMAERSPTDPPLVLGWTDFDARADSVPTSLLQERIASIRPGDVATLIYTSGTTGAPKAVQLTHANLAFTQRTYQQALNHRSEDDELVSYLPLSHIAEQNLTLHGQMAQGYTVWFCPKLELLPDVLREARPTLFFAVPRVWERIEARLKEAFGQAPWHRRKLLSWARSVGLRASTARLQGSPPPRGYPLARRLVFDKIRQRLGLDRCKMLVSGAAKLPKDTLEFFLSLDLVIHEVYGMSENCAMTTLNLPSATRIGTVGRPLPGVEVKIASDGEILVRGQHVFAGYLRDEAATREAIDADGWLHTGDVGQLDADGYLTITDRKKELIKTSGGKYVAPAHVEGLLGTIEGVGVPVLVGEGRKTCVALLALDPEQAPRVAEKLGIAERSLEALSQDARFRAYLEEKVAAINAQLASFESVKAFAVLPQPFGIDTGELTPTLKLKRKVVLERYASAIEALYAGLG